jgi:hypothetical protein
MTTNPLILADYSVTGVCNPSFDQYPNGMSETWTDPQPMHEPGGGPCSYPARTASGATAASPAGLGCQALRPPRPAPGRACGQIHGARLKGGDGQFGRASRGPHDTPSRGAKSRPALSHPMRH